MKTWIAHFIVSAVVFGVMDSLWFALFMRKLAFKELRPLLNMVDGKMQAHYPSVFMAYLLMIIIAVVFLVPRLSPSMGLLSTFAIGAVMGLCVFGIFDFTNSALFSPYPFKFVMTDVAWGGFMYGCLAVIIAKLTPLISHL